MVTFIIFLRSAKIPALCLKTVKTASFRWRVTMTSAVYQAVIEKIARKPAENLVWLDGNVVTSVKCLMTNEN